WAIPSGVASGGNQAINQSPPFERTENSSPSCAIEYPNIVISITTGHDRLTPIRRTIKRQTDTFEEAALAEAMPHLPGIERQSLAIQDRADLIHQAKIQELTHESFQISMSVPSRPLLGESLAEVNEQIHDAVIRIAPVYVSKITNCPKSHF